ncbi:sugar ABC transporter permease [Candidatus Epulonipiscium fishelsonii]|uniref:Sugar ABC transporter permease n=1 Tax=Candidatus Epulonipiscium fishelsonii TaxID=77094 RepID=A0ACC8X879_9FIRM|nr:sugar ABC transporter permease [Epulopiscium sp. SCG-B11WGA-EpuloA1]ONI40546.1 sugar ABC transporter permease [Epulopiscium sp. SCG-B05WGA-EpuloA1]
MNRTKRNLLEFVAILIMILVLCPFLLIIINSAKDSGSITRNPIGMPEDWTLIITNLKAVINNPQFNYYNSFFSSIFITVVTLILNMYSSSMAAWILARNKTRWSNFIFMLFVAAMVIPFQVVMLPMISTFRDISDIVGLPFLNSYFGVIFAYLGFGGSMAIFIIHGFVKGIPLELEESAMIDGCTKERMFFAIIFPMLRPVRVTILILNGMWIWNDFLLPSLMLGMNGKIKTLPIAVTSFVGSYVKQWDLILSAAFLAMLPVIILFIIAQKYIISGMVEGSIK